MARTRRVETNEILDAAERVVVRSGAVGLSLDAVAKEAGISKTRVVYDFKSKSALIEALITRRIRHDRDELAQLAEANAATPHPELFARIQQAEKAPAELDVALALIVTASLGSEDAIHGHVKELVDSDISAMETGNRPRAAYIAHMALTGFLSHEWFGLKTWTDAERSQMLKDIKTLYSCFPDDHDQNKSTR